MTASGQTGGAEVRFYIEGRELVVASGATIAEAAEAFRAQVDPDAPKCPDCKAPMTYVAGAPAPWVCPKGVADAVDAVLDKRQPRHRPARGWTEQELDAHYTCDL